MPDFIKEAQNIFVYTKDLRRDFHRFPELGFQEVRTSATVAKELHELGLEVTSGIAKTGVVALIEGLKPGPVGLLRVDMDALPILEATGAEYASQNPGVMHACGHDGHTAIGLTVARLINNNRENLAGTIKLVFQPAEEGLGGAEAMLQAGVLENPRPDYCLALHLWNEKPLGWIGAAPGPVMAASETFQIRLVGKGGHGASPHQAIDPVFAAAQVINALQSIVSRNTNPLKSSVVSVTAVKAGQAHNVIPNEAELKGTIRSFEPEIRNMVLERFHSIVHGVAEALGCRVEIEIKSITPAVVNDPQITSQVQKTLRKLFPETQIDDTCQTMGSEDMAFFQKEVPGCYVFVGSADSGRSLDYPHHHPKFDFDETALWQASAAMAAMAFELAERASN